MSINLTVSTHRISREYDKCRRKLFRAITGEFPVGCRVRAILGHRLVYGNVTAVDDWHTPGVIYFTNERTGKLRRANALFDRHDVQRIDINITGRRW